MVDARAPIALSSATPSVNTAIPADATRSGLWANNIVDATIEPGEPTEVGALDCARVFSIGGPRLLDLIERNLTNVEPDPSAMIEGVAFYEADVDEPTEADLVGSAPAFEALLGVDFPCESLLIILFEPGDAPDQFRIDFELIPSESTR